MNYTCIGYMYASFKKFSITSYMLPKVSDHYTYVYSMLRSTMECSWVRINSLLIPQLFKLDKPFLTKLLTNYFSVDRLESWNGFS